MTYPEQNGHVHNADGNEGRDDAELNDVTTFNDTATTITMASQPDTMSIITASDVTDSTNTALPPKPPDDDVPPSCRTGYCRNMTFFVACMAIIYLVRGALLQYTEDILTHIGRRYPITAPELAFVVGCERVGFVSVLLFVAFFGNRMHKPWAISIGVLICALGSMLMAVPFFMSGPRLFDTKISQFAIAGLCKQTSKNVSFQKQCDLIPFKDGDGVPTFTIICFANLLVGIGGALYASLGLVYIEEGCKPHRLPLYLGMVICMHGYGGFLGNLLAAWFTSFPEAINAAGSQRLKQDYAVYNQERVGRWWVGYPVFASLFTCLSLMTLWFPRYINVPDWVMRRRAKRARLQAELERRLKLKALAAKKRHASEANEHRKSKARHRGRRRGQQGESKGSREKGIGDGWKDEKVEGEDGTLGVVNGVDVMADEAVRDSGDQGKSGKNEKTDRKGKKQKKVKTGKKGKIYKKSRKSATHSDVAVEEGDTDVGDDVDDSVNLDDLPSDVREHGTYSSSLEVNMEEEEEGEREKDLIDDERKEKGSKKVRGKGSSRARRSSKVGASESVSAKRRYRQQASGSGTSAAFQHKPRRIRIKKESLSDLPHTVLRLLQNIRVLIVMFGAVLGGFYFNGYLKTLPEYMNVQFQRSWKTSFILAGVTGPLAWGMGTQLGGVLLFRFRSVPLYRMTLGVVGCIFACCVLTLLSMAFQCVHDTSPNSTATTYCGERCECDSYLVQYEPLCGSDGKTYPTPCHAGCKAIQKTSTVGLFKFTGCDCVGGGTALQGACVPQCNQMAGFIIVTFIAVFILSVGIVPIFALLFRSVRSRSKSFAVGFAVWVVYTLSQTLGPVAFTYLRENKCRRWGEDCLEEKVCWGYNQQAYRVIVSGLAAAFLFASGMTFLLVSWYSNRSRIRKLRQEAAATTLQLEPASDAVSISKGTHTGDDVTTHAQVDHDDGIANVQNHDIITSTLADDVASESGQGNDEVNTPVCSDEVAVHISPEVNNSVL